MEIRFIRVIFVFKRFFPPRAFSSINLVEQRTIEESTGAKWRLTETGWRVWEKTGEEKTEYRKF